MYMKYNYHAICDLNFGKGHFPAHNFDQINVNSSYVSPLFCTEIQYLRRLIIALPDTKCY